MNGRIDAPTPYDVVKCISLHQPHATLWVRGPKRYETRDWHIHYRGWVAVHAAKYWTAEYRTMCLGEPFFSTLFPPGLTRGDVLMRPELWPERGAIVGMVFIEASVKAEDPMLQLFLSTNPNEREFGNFEHGRKAWRAADHREFIHPIPLSGKQGLFNLPEHLTGRNLLAARPYHQTRAAVN